MFLEIVLPLITRVLLPLRRSHNNYNAAVTQWFRALSPQTRGWVFKSQQRQTKALKTGRDNSTSKRLGINLSVTGPGDDHFKRMPRITVKVAS